jgi:acylphosphatase
MTKKVRAIVSGRVQGVWYRAHTRDKARELGLHGYVRNLADGNVEIVALGDESAVDALIDWSWTGPPMSRVTDVQVEPFDESVGGGDFEVRY